MKPIHLLISALAIVVHCSHVYGQSRIINDIFYSPALDTDQTIFVYLPDGYTETDSLRYPVIYLLHGAGADPVSLALFAPFLRIYFDDIILRGIIPPLLFVIPDGSAPPFLGSFYTNSALYGNFEDYIVYDLVHYIDGAYKTQALRERRFIVGHSMGGYGAMKLAIKHPDVYGAVAAHSGPLDLNQLRNVIPQVLSENGGTPPYRYSPDAGTFTNLGFSMAGAFSPNLTQTPYPVDFPLDSNGVLIDSVFAKWLFHNPAALAKQLAVDSDLAIYFDCGTQDELLVYPFNTAFADSLDNLGLVYQFQSYTGGHSELLFERMEISLAFIDSVMLASPITTVDHSTAQPSTVVLHQNYPNPFNPVTTIQFSIARAANVTLSIYNLLGQRVATLLSERLPAGEHKYVWRPQGLVSGTYFYRLQADGMVKTKSLVLLR